MRNKGFTLIELLVVVAIIGILASVVLASLNSARNRGADAAIKAALANSRAQAELFNDSFSSYDNGTQAVCTTGTNNINSMIDNAAKRLSSTQAIGGDSVAFVYASGGGAGAAICHDSSTGWMAVVSLKSPVTASAGWCVDSTGASKEAVAGVPVGNLGANDLTCD